MSEWESIEKIGDGIVTEMDQRQLTVTVKLGFAENSYCFVKSLPASG